MRTKRSGSSRCGKGEVEAVARVHPLAQRVDDRPEGVQERGTGFGVRERGVTAQYLPDIGVDAQAGATQQPSHQAAGAEDPIIDEEREEPGRLAVRSG
jgi:hypothetical protein